MRDAFMTDVKTTAYKRRRKGAESGVYDHHAKEDKSICTLDKALFSESDNAVESQPSKACTEQDASTCNSYDKKPREKCENCIKRSREIKNITRQCKRQKLKIQRQKRKIKSQKNVS